MKATFNYLITTIGVTGFLAISTLVITGWAYWMWMAITFGSFGMFLFGILGPLGFFAAVIGLWSLAFGAPIWLIDLVL